MSVQLSAQGAIIKTALEGQSDTNTLTDAELTKLTDLPDASELTASLEEKQPITPRVSSSASSATPTPNADTTDAYVLTALAEAAAFAAPSGTPSQGQAMILRIKDNGTARALSWNAIYRAIGVTLPATTVLGKTLYMAMIYNSTDTKWDVLSVSQEA